MGVVSTGPDGTWGLGLRSSPLTSEAEAGEWAVLWAEPSSWWAFEHAWALLRDAGGILQEPGVRKGPHRVSLTGPPASVKQEEESSGEESPTSSLRNTHPSLGPGE